MVKNGRLIYKKYREEIIKMLGGKCKICGSTKNLHIHHKIKTLRGAGRGRFERLYDWKRNKDKIELLCRDCHFKVEFEHHNHIPFEYKPGRFRCLDCGRFIKSEEAMRNLFKKNYNKKVKENE